VNIYGWNAQNKESLAEWVLRRLEEGRDVPGFTDVFFTPLLANDLAAILFAMLQRELTGLYHVVGSERISKFEFARASGCRFWIRSSASYTLSGQRYEPEGSATAGCVAQHQKNQSRVGPFDA
jgi:hypothetical protein